MIRRFPLLGPRIARKALLFSLALIVAVIGLLSGTRGRAFGPMPLGNYADTTVQLGANTTVIPDAAPTNTTSLNVSTSTNFKGRLEGNPTTGIVRVTNAHPAGTYTVTVTAFDGVPTTKTFTLTVTTPATCNPVSFAAVANFAVGNLPFSVAVGDFNGDGKQDLANVNANLGNVSVLLGDGAGSFGAATNFSEGNSPRSVAVGDFNGDGKQDLATANTVAVSVLLGNGAGGFSAATNFAAGTSPVSVATGDFNGDGKQDLAAANVNSSNVSVLLGDGAGSFSAATNFAVGTNPFSVAVGDFNGDGKQDLAVANQNSATVSVLLGNGAGSFSTATNFGVGSGPFSVAVGDFNGDGKQDLSAANFSSNNVSVLLGDGAGSFGAANNVGVGMTPLSVAVADFNGDGKQDLATANSSSTNVSVLLGDGAGSFGAATNFGVGTTPRSVAVGDFNGDGKQDLATANQNSANVSVLLRQCPCTSPPANLVAWYPAEGNANDIKGGNHGTLQNGAAFAVGKVGQAFSLDGLDDQIFLGNPASLRITADLTIDAWVNPVDVNAGQLASIVTKWGFDGSTDSYGLWLTKQAGIIKVLSGIGDAAGSGDPGLIGGTLAANTWAHVAMTYQASSGLHTIYVNGQQVGQRTRSGGIRDTVTNAVIGREDSSQPRPFNGRIDEASIYNRTLSQAELQTIVNADSAGKCSFAATLTVTNTNDSGAGSLRQAILDSNSTPGVQTIAFNIPGSGVHTIAPVTPLPDTTDGVTIDGATQPGFSGTPLIELNGAGAGANADGLHVTAGSTTVRALIVNRFTRDGIALIGGAGGSTVQGCYVGTNAAGTLALANGGNGVTVNGTSNNTIGGTTATARNVISGNAQSGLLITGSGSTGNLVQGNFIGTNAAGTSALGNFRGLFVTGTSSNNTIGGTTSAARNVISGNTNPGIDFSNASGNTVQGNYIGTNAAGTAALGNALAGVFINAASGNAIGGTAPGAGNLISGNTARGIAILINASGNTVQGNLVGTQANGTAALGNGFEGVLITQSSSNIIGGTVNGAGNTIAFNGAAGVFLDSSANNAVLSNSIYANAGLGIQRTAGANNNQAVPVITSASSSAGSTTISGSVTVPPNTGFTLQFFANDTCDPSGSGEGQILLGTNVDPTGSPTGASSVSVTLPVTVVPGQVVTATVTDANNNSSAFSVCHSVTTASFSISGRVVDDSANPLSGVAMTLSGTSSANTTTDGSGNYVFANLVGGGNYTVTPSSGNHSFSPASQTFNNLSVNRIANFVGTQTVVIITGRVTDAANVGISDVAVQLTRNGAPAGTAITDNLGNYGFGSLAAGANYVVTPVGSFSPSSQAFTNLTVNAVANFTASPSIPPQCSTVSFGRTDFAAGSLLSSVAIGDFNGDGKSDLAVANTGTDNVSILLGTGTGSFGAATNFAVGLAPRSVAIGDFNGDGKSDLAVANFSSANVSILLGTGTGSFSAATNFAVGSGPFSVAIGDFNDDGKSDLAVANSGFNNNVSILLGSGTGSFSAATNFAVGTSPDSVAIGDFNADGKSDLATANSPTSGSGNVSILLGTGTGSFSPATNFAAGSGPRSVAIGDFNGDGKSDLATANSGSNNVSILLGTGTGSFAVATSFAVEENPFFVTLGDFNGDGKSDLAVANASANSNAVSILLGTGTGSFSAATNFVVGSLPEHVAVGDLNGDGKSDLAVANFLSNNVSILLNNGATCNTQTSLSISGRLADVNNNPLPDVTVTLSGPITRVAQTGTTGNYTFSNLVPGGNYAVTIQSPQYVFAPSRADFFNLSSNQTANFTAAPVVVPITLPPPNDDFSSPTRDPNKWNLGTQTQPPTAFDPQINVAQINGQLMITPLTQVSGMHYNGYVSANSFDMRGGTVSVELVQAATGGADTIFAVGSDSDNFYRFMVHTAGPGPSPALTGRGRDGIERPLDTTVAQLVFQINVGGVLTTAAPIPYDPVQHRFMRFRHDAPANAIVFETSPDNIAFTERHRVVLVRSVSALTAELSAGTSNPTNPGATVFDNFGLVTSTFQFSSASYTVDEGGGSILITVTRAGSTAATATVDYATSDGTALQSSDYILAAGRLTFEPGESSKTFRVLIVDNSQAEGNQNLNLLLQEPSASGLNTPGRAVLTIIDNDTTVPTANPLENPTFFVTQHYYDFLNRVPDAAGLAFWIDQITSCGSDTQCIDIRRINVSAAYFLSIEYQDTGFLVHRFYNLALNRPNGLPRYLEFFRDSRAIGNGVVVGDPGWEALLEANTVAYANEFAARAEYTALYPFTLTSEQYVDALYAHAGITPSAAERQAAIAEFSNPTGARGRVLRRVSENQTLRAREFNRAFVLAQYFGYLRRNPDDAPDNNLDGYNFWLGKLNQFNGNFVNAEMVKAFITSGEYRHRFGP